MMINDDDDNGDDDDDNGAAHDSSCQSRPGPRCIDLESSQAGRGRIL